MRGEGVIYQRGPSWWIRYSVKGRRFREPARVPDKAGILRPAKTPAEARRALKARREEVLGGRFIGPKAERLTVSDLLDSLEAHLTAKRIRSLAKVKIHAKPLRAFFALRRAVDVTPAQVDHFKVERRAAGRAEATVNRELELLRQAYRLAVRHRELSPAHVPAVDLLPVDNARSGFFTPAEVAALLPQLEAALADFVEWCATTGQRKGEASLLTWKMLDRSSAVWAFNIPASITKTKRGRVLPVVGTARTIIERRLAARRLGCELVFHRTSKGKAAQPIKAFDKAWRALKTAGLPTDRLVHDLRRSAVRNLVRAGVDPLQAMAVSGHRTRSVFDRYNITSADEVAAAMLRVDEAKAKGHI